MSESTMTVYILKAKCASVSFTSAQTIICKKCFANKDKAEAFKETWRSSLLEPTDDFFSIDQVLEIGVYELELEEN